MYSMRLGDDSMRLRDVQHEVRQGTALTGRKVGFDLGRFTNTDFLSLGI